MDLLLWRHAEAEDGADDLRRALTGKGRDQAARVAAWLAAHAPVDAHLVVSPAVRATQTADALQRAYTVDARLAPGRSARDVLAAADWPDAKGTTIVVGHQPTLGDVAAELLGDAGLSLWMKKGGVWWFSRRSGDETRLRCVISADFC